MQQIKGVCQLEIIQMDISPNGQYLLVVTGVPSYEISIWNIETASKIEGNESKLPLKLNFVNAFFCQHESN